MWRREKEQCKKYCSFFWRSLQSCGTRELRRKCIFTHFCTHDSDFGLEELTLHRFSSWRREVLCVGPFLKEHNLIQALTGWEQFFMCIYIYGFGFFYIKFLTWFGDSKIYNSNFSPVHSSCNTEVTCKIVLLHSVNMCVFPVSLVCKQTAQTCYFGLFLVSLFCLILNSERNSSPTVQGAFLSVAWNI